MSDDLEDNFNKSSALIAEFYHDKKVTPPANIPELDTPLSLINIDKYEIKGLIDTGGMKKIYEVVDRDSTRHLAMAIPDSTDEDTLNQFIFEARVTALLEHPNIIPVHDIGLRDKLPCFTMKLINGDTLSQLIKKIYSQNNFSSTQLNDLITIFLKVCDAIAYAHSKGIMHLDIKPDNIRISNYGEVQVLDWGLAKFFNHNPHQLDTLTIDTSKLSDDTNSILGSPAFMSPEQCSNQQISYYSDIYSLGAILYSILTLHPPFYNEKDYKQILRKTKLGELPKPSDLNLSWFIPSGLEAICLKAMSIRPQDRYENVGELIQDIRKWNNNYAPLALNAPPLHITKLFFKRNKVLLFVINVFILIILFISINSYQSLKLSERQAHELAFIADENAQRAQLTLNDLKITEAQRQENLKELFQSHIQIQEALEQLEAMEETNITLAQIAVNQLLIDAKKALSQSLLQKAFKRAQQSVEIDPDNPEVISIFAQTLLLQGKVSKAKIFFHKINIHRFDSIYQRQFNHKNLDTFIHTYKILKKDKLFKRSAILFLTSLDHFNLNEQQKLYVFKNIYKNMDISISPSEIVIDKEFINILPLTQLPIKSIHSKFHIQHSYNYLDRFKELKEFYLANTVGFNLSQLTHNKNLHKISFTNCHLFGDTSKLHTREIVLNNTVCKSYTFLTKINELQHLIYTKSSSIPEAILKDLKTKNIKLTKL